MRVIKLTQGYFAIIDEGDLDAVSMCPWHVRAAADENTQYANGRPPGFPGKISLHTFLWKFCWGLPRAVQLDHKNRNGLDCRRSNLRDATSSQNHANSGTAKNNSSGVKGVVWSKASQKWQAQIKFQKNLVYLGQFAELNDAALAYQVAARRMFGEFARF